MDKLTDVLEELWTGKGIEVQAGPHFSEFCFKGFHDKAFQEMIVGKLTDEGYWADGKIIQLEEADLRSVRMQKEEGKNDLKYHELEFQLKGRAPYGKFDLRLGAEFQAVDKAKGTYRLKLFPVVQTQRGSMRIVASQNPELIEQLSKEFYLMHWLLQETGYLNKSEN
jgi:hypothetical protein